jgi:hypothetical protein
MRGDFAGCRVRPIVAIVATLVLSLASACGGDDARLASAETEETPSEPAVSPTPTPSAIESVEPAPTQPIPSPTPSPSPVVRSRPPAPPAAPPPPDPPPAPNPPGVPTGDGSGTAVGAPIKIPEFLVYAGHPVTEVRSLLEDAIRRGCDGSLCVTVQVEQQAGGRDMCTVARVVFPAESVREQRTNAESIMNVPRGSVVTITTGTAPCPTPTPTI